MIMTTSVGQMGNVKKAVSADTQRVAIVLIRPALSLQVYLFTLTEE